jgi:hypothetical protein
MFVHWAKQINAERVGGRIVRVACARCSCEYFYKFTRIGAGSGTAHYGLGVGRATLAANKQAQTDLDRRLASEAELVPCPKCNWINDELVAGFRRGSYRKLSDAATLIAAAGVVVGVILGLIFGFTSPVALGYALILPAVLLLAGGGLFLLRNWLRSRIRPNRDHPLPPQLPPASPPALVRDPASGQLVSVKQGQAPSHLRNEWVDFQIGRQTWPPVCCDCLQPASLDRGHPMKLTTTLRLTIPCCAECAQSTQRRFRRLLWNGATASILVTAAVVIPLNLDWVEFCIASIGLLVVSFAVSVPVARRMMAPGKVVGGDRSRGVVRLRFRNAAYARAVAEHLNG